MYELSPQEFDCVRPVFQPLNYQLAVQCILDGAIQGRIFVDDRAHPRSAFTWTGHRYYLAGDCNNLEFNYALGCYFNEEIYPHCIQAGQWMFMLNYKPSGWEKQMDTILAGKYPIHSNREYYVFKDFNQDWRAMLPEGFSLRLVDPDLIQNKDLEHIDHLLEELCSERPSIEDFLDKSFGVCLLHRNELAGWCLSEYNRPGKCEIGIETQPHFRQRGLATLMTSAFVEEAQKRGIQHIGWDCWASNLPSSATARKAGFELMYAYEVDFACFRPADNYGMHGNVLVEQAKYPEALEWFDKAYALPDVPGWALWNAASAAADCGQQERAGRYLRLGLERGLIDRKKVENTEKFKGINY